MTVHEWAPDCEDYWTCVCGATCDSEQPCSRHGACARVTDCSCGLWLCPECRPETRGSS